MRVKQIMTADVRHGNRFTSVDEAVSLMKNNDIGFLPMIDDESHELIGVITDRDVLLRAVYGHLDIRLMPVTDLMSDTVVTVKPEDTVDRALRVMAMHQMRRLPVVDKTMHLVGVITLADIVRSDAVSPKALATALRKIIAPSMVSCVNRSLLLKTCAA
jgi:CBS domain-containing protein